MINDSEENRGGTEGKPPVNPNLIPFVPGVSGNPKGRPKGVKDTAAELRKLLRHPLTLADKDGNKKTKKGRQWLAAKLFQQALNGNLGAIDRVLDRAEGAVAQEHRFKSLDSNEEIIAKRIAKKIVDEASK